MPQFVSRALTVLFLLAVAIYLVPDEQDTSAEEPIVRDTLLSRGGAAPVPKDLIIVEDISYRKGNRHFWALDLAMPKLRGEKPRPALLFVHGGGWSSGDKRLGIFKTAPIEYAQKGYVCISVNYRLTGEAAFPACMEDVKCAVRWLRAHAEKYNVDPHRIGGYGNSAGAHLVSLLALVGKDKDLEGDGPWQDQSSMLNAVCVSAVPTDFTSWPSGIENKPRLRKFLEQPDASLEEQAVKASPISYVHANAPPFLIFQGTRDRLVHVAQADQFVKALKATGAKDVTYHRYPGAGHGVFTQNRKETYPLMEEFFERTLMNAKSETVDKKANSNGE
ncbi:alpha/beta hydrolase [uncultured Gimesia sp.]|mgnify:CR=1 FL=1|uniref:alpha/beta hydrolase n=1 Tax=uncultured Gimesia sp. TaxID=1678688 RepID=UPI0030DBD2AB|tara:strand:- start:27563 stop:28561 length:999 start_codon:yes stop_codon:yes gene_type:complete